LVNTIDQKNKVREGQDQLNRPYFSRPVDLQSGNLYGSSQNIIWNFIVSRVLTSY